MEIKDKEIESLERLVKNRDDDIKKLHEDKNWLTEELIICRREKEILTKQRDNYKNKVDTFCKEKSKTLTIGTVDTIAHLIASYYGRLSQARVGREIADACWTILCDVVQYQLMCHARCY